MASELYRVGQLHLAEPFASMHQLVRCEILRRRDEVRIRALRFDRLDCSSAPLQPQLLENRATLLMVAAEMLRMLEDRTAINTRIANGLLLSVLARRALDNPDTRRSLRLGRRRTANNLRAVGRPGETAVSRFVRFWRKSHQGAGGEIGNADHPSQGS